MKMKKCISDCLLGKYIISICLLIFFNQAFAQENSTNSANDTVSSTSPAYMPVDYAYLDPLFINFLKFIPIDTSVVEGSRFDPLLNTNNLYQSLGIGGQAHQSINFDFTRDVGFSYFQFPYPLYYKTQKDIAFYRLKTSFTKIHYTFGIPSENKFAATHAQKFRNITAIFNLNGYLNEGYYPHQKNGNIIGDFTLHYELPSEIYGFRASYIYNRFRIEENGGLFDMDNFKDQMTTNLQGYNMKLYYAFNNLQSHDFLFHQYVNLQLKTKKSKKSHYLGTISHTFQYKNVTSRYTDIQPDSLYYRYLFYSSADSTADSISFQTFINTIQWTSYKPYREVSNNPYFIHFSGGLRHEYTETEPHQYFGHNFTLFGSTHIRLFSVVDIFAKLSYAFSDYNHNDAIAEATAKWYLNRKKAHLIGLNAQFYRFAPDYIYSYYQGNHNRWDTTWKKENVLKLSTYWQYGNYRVSVNYFMLKNRLILDNNYNPLLIDKYASVMQFQLFLPVRIKNFGFDINAWLQHSDNKYIPVPLFAGKSTIFYVFRLFQNKMQLQLGVDMMYNTNYFANGYYPLLHQFYHQEKNFIGNYFYFDSYINFKVQRIQFYFRLSHALSGLMGYNYFTTPNYPMQGRGYVLGINWRFYD